MAESQEWEEAYRGILQVGERLETSLQRFVTHLRRVVQEHKQEGESDMLHVAADCCLHIADSIDQSTRRLTYPQDSSSSSSDPQPPLKRARKGKEEEKVSVPPQPLQPPQKLCLWTDGACKNNGRAGAVAGIGVFFGAGDRRNVSERYQPKLGLPATNNTAELSAAVRGLEIALQQPAVTHIVLHTDSQYTIDCVTKWIPGWQRNGWRTATRQPVKNQPLVKRLWELAYGQTKVKVEFVHVPGHAGVVENEWADQLASQACS